MAGFYSSVYVKVGVVGGDGSLSNPFGTIQQALDHTQNSLLIFLFPGEHSLGGVHLEITDREPVEIRSVATLASTITNFLSITSHETPLKITNCILEPASQAETQVFISDNGMLSFEDCSFSKFVNVRPGTTFIALSGIISLVGCIFDLSAFDTSWDRVDSIIEIHDGGSLLVNDCEFNHLLVNSPIILSKGNNVSIDIGYSNFSNGKLSFMEYVDESSIVKMIAPVAETQASLSINYCNFKNVPRAVFLSRPAGSVVGATDFVFRTSYDGKLNNSAIIAKNYFINNKITLDTRLVGTIGFYNNTIYRGHFGISAIDGATVDCVNSIFSLLQETPNPDDTLPISRPYAISVFYLANAGAINVAYSCLDNNAYDEFASGASRITRGPGVRFIDPMFTDAFNADFSLQASSPMIDAGNNMLSSYLGARSDIGAFETRLSEVAPPTSYFTHKTRPSVDALATTQMDINTYLRTRLKEEFVNINTDTGSVVNDLLMKPVSTMLAPAFTAINSIYWRQSLQNADLMSDFDMDRLAANYFVSRRSNRNAFGTVRIYVTVPIDLAVPKTASFPTKNGITFYPTIDYNFTKAEMAHNRDLNEGFYYVDALVETTGTPANEDLDPGSINSSSLTDLMITKIGNPFGFTAGIPYESNTSFASRIKDTAVVRNMTNVKSIIAVLKDKFEYIDDLEVVGFGDPEMQRDTIPISDSHLGGCVDIYLKTKSYLTSSIYTTLNSGLTLRVESGNIPAGPIISVFNAYVVDQSTSQDISAISPQDFSFTCLNPNYRFSDREVLLFTFTNPVLVGKYIRIEFQGCPMIKEVNEFVSHPMQRLVCVDTVAKHFIPAIVSMTINYYALNAVVGLADLIKEYIYELNSDNNELSVLKLEEFIKSLGVQQLDRVLTITVSIANNSDSSMTVNTVTDSISIPRISRFIPGNIITNYLKRG